MQSCLQSSKLGTFWKTESTVFKICPRIGRNWHCAMGSEAQLLSKYSKSRLTWKKFNPVFLKTIMLLVKWQHHLGLNEAWRRRFFFYLEVIWWIRDRIAIHFWQRTLSSLDIIINGPAKEKIRVRIVQKNGVKKILKSSKLYKPASEGWSSQTTCHAVFPASILSAFSGETVQKMTGKPVENPWPRAARARSQDANFLRVQSEYWELGWW